jgi:hypothetical protein
MAASYDSFASAGPADADKLFEAESPGGYLNERIKPRYRYEHV